MRPVSDTVGLTTCGEMNTNPGFCWPLGLTSHTGTSNAKILRPSPRTVNSKGWDLWPLYAIFSLPENGPGFGSTAMATAGSMAAANTSTANTRGVEGFTVAQFGNSA